MVGWNGRLGFILHFDKFVDDCEKSTFKMEAKSLVFVAE